MNSKIEWLLGLVLAQLALVGVILFSGSLAQNESPTFSDLKENQIKAIVVSDLESEVRIEKGEAQWSVDDYLGDADKITGIVEKILALDAAWPVANSVSAAERFEVATDKYQRKLSFYGNEGETLESFYLGTSPSYQRVHARQAGSGDIFSVKLSNYEFGLKKDDWLDKSLAKITGDITEVHLVAPNERDSVKRSLVERDGVWEIEGQLADQASAKNYVTRFGNLRVLGIADGSGEKVSEVKLLADGKEVVYSLFAVFDNEGEIEDYILESSEVKGSFRVATYVAEQILLTDTDLLPSDSEEGSES